MSTKQLSHTNPSVEDKDVMLVLGGVLLATVVSAAVANHYWHDTKFTLYTAIAVNFATCASVSQILYAKEPRSGMRTSVLTILALFAGYLAVKRNKALKEGTATP